MALVLVMVDDEQQTDCDIQIPHVESAYKTTPSAQPPDLLPMKCTWVVSRASVLRNADGPGAEPPLSPLRNVGKLAANIASVFYVCFFVLLMSCGIFRVYYNFVASVMEPLGLL